MSDEQCSLYVVHRFTVGDVEDPQLYAAQPLWEWEHSECGQWVLTHAVEEPTWETYHDPQTYGIAFRIVARLRDSDATLWLLRWGT